MAGFKLLKRKGGVDEINHDFSDFSLASPATKIRRLDCGLPPIVEEDETLTVTPPPSAPPNNEERALVLFKPIQHHSPSSSFSLSLNSDLISQFNKNNQFAWSKQCDYNRLIELREEEEEDNNNKNRGLAIVPWVPKVQQQQPSPLFSSSHFDDNNNAELMDADEIEEGMMMDVEPEQQQQQEEDAATATSTFQHPMSMAMGEGFQQQQHCLLPQLPQNNSTPITWTWTR